MWEEENFLKIAKSTFPKYLDIFDEIDLSRTVKEIEANFVFFHLWQKFKMAAIFGKRKIF